MRQLAGRVACLAAALCLVMRGVEADPSVKPLRLRFDARFVLAEVAQQMGVTLRPDFAPPAVFLESNTPISQFRDAIGAQWGFRPHLFSNAYAVERNEIYLIDEPSIYVRRGRTIDGSLAHELAHYIQVKYLNADLAEPSWEDEANEIQKWFRDMHLRTRTATLPSGNE
jgi:hypothetical protein